MKYLPIICLFMITFSIKVYAVNGIHSQPLSELTVLQKYQFPALVIALNYVTLSSELEGIVQSKTLLVGSKVDKNQSLVQIDCTDNSLKKEQGIAVLKRLQAQKELAQQQLKRARQLVRVKSVSKQELDQKQTTLDADIASLEQQTVALKIIDHNISKCRIKAPFNGVITEYMAQKSSYVIPGSPLLTLIDLNSVEIEVALPLNLATQLSSIKNINFKQNNQNYSLSIRALLPKIDPISKLQKIRLSLNNHKHLPLPNSIGFMTWKSNQVYLPSQYIVMRNNQLGVFIEQNGKAIFHTLQHAIEGQNSKINLLPKTLIITNKLLILNNNDKIN